MINGISGSRPPFFPGKLIASGSFPAAANLDVTNIPLAFSKLGILISGASCDTASREFAIQVSNDNGATFANTAPDYRGNKIASGTSSVKSTANAVESATQAAAAVRTGELIIEFPNVFSSPYFHYFINDGVTMWTGSGQISIGNINALRFLWLGGAGNFDAGTYAIYGS